MGAVAVLIPVINEDILNLSGYTIGVGWVIAIAGPLGCLFLCEMWKIVTGWQIDAYQKKRKEMEQRAVALRNDDQKFAVMKNANEKLVEVVVQTKNKLDELERQVSAGQEATKAAQAAK